MSAHLHRGSDKENFPRELKLSAKIPTDNNLLDWNRLLRRFTLLLPLLEKHPREKFARLLEHTNLAEDQHQQYLIPSSWSAAPASVRLNIECDLLDLALEVVTTFSAEAYNTTTYPEVLKTMARFIDGTPKVHTSDVVSSTCHKIAVPAAA